MSRFWGGLWILLGFGLTLNACSTGSRVEQITADDPYLWLEEVESPRAFEWVKQRNSQTEKKLTASAEFRSLQQRILDGLQSSDRIPHVFVQNGRLLNFWQDAKSIAGVLRVTSISAYESGRNDWRVVFDLDRFNKRTGKNWVWKGMRCLERTDRCLIRLSPGGTDAVWVREFDLSSGDFVKGGFDFPIAKTSADWWDLNTVLVGTDFGPGSLTDSGYPRLVKSIKRGQMLEEGTTLIEGLKSDVWVGADVLHHGDAKVMFLVRATSFFKSLKYLIGEDGLPVEFRIPLDSEVVGLFGSHFLIQLRSTWNVKGRTVPAGSLVAVERTSSLDPDPIALFQPTSTQVLKGVSVLKGRVLLSVLDNVEGRIIEVSKVDDKWLMTPVKGPSAGAVDIVTADEDQDFAYFEFENFLTPSTLFKLENSTVKPLRSLSAKFKTDGHLVERRFALSRDGTQVPYFVVRSKKKGPAPTLMYGYGGFEIAIEPHYSTTIGRAWIEQGYNYVVANIRGGGEFGPRWHQAALRENRNKSFEDFEAVAEDLVRQGFTTSRQLAIRGGSNGGLLVTATMVRRPDLYGAVVSEVPLIDMIRFHKLLAGSSWVEEYGNPENKQDFRFLLGMSPYHNLKAGASYPPIFVTTSTKDDRVHPGHARKFVAKLEALQQPVFYFENMEGGHARAADLPQMAKIQALQFVFLRSVLTK